jgi:hypothetical protein
MTTVGLLKMPVLSTIIPGKPYSPGKTLEMVTGNSGVAVGIEHGCSVAEGMT